MASDRSGIRVMIDALLHREHTPHQEVRDLVDAITRLRPFPEVVATYRTAAELAGVLAAPSP